MVEKLCIFGNFKIFVNLLIENDLFRNKKLTKLLTNSDDIVDNKTESQLLFIIADMESRNVSKIKRFGKILRQSQFSDCLMKVWVPSIKSDGNEEQSVNELEAEVLRRFQYLMSPTPVKRHFLEITNAKKFQTQEDVYTMTARPRGFCIIIDNQSFDKPFLPFRRGSKEDADRLESVFTQLYFEVKRYTNSTSARMKSILKITKKSREKFVGHNALVVIILSHGDNDGIYGSDGKTIEVKQIINYFNNERCPGLIDKPKMFFINACRGRNVDKGVNRMPLALCKRLSNSSEANIIPLWSDILVFYSSVRDYVSFRNVVSGSWFGYHLAHCLAEFAHIEHLNDLMTTKVAQKLHQQVTQDLNGNPVKQPIEAQIIGRVKKVYFNPGLSKEH